jgi:dipeptidase E
MRFLLTSAGIKNTSIHAVLVDLLGKPIAESSALCIPTAMYPNPDGAGHAWRFISGREARTPCANWVGSPWESWSSPRCPASQGALDPHARGDRRPAGGRRRSAVSVLLDAPVRAGGPLPSLREAVYAGLSAGSMVMAPNIGEDFVRWKPPTGGDETLGLVGFSIFPHLDHEDRHQGDRWCRRSRLRGALETVHPLGPRPLRQEMGVFGCRTGPLG